MLNEIMFGLKWVICFIGVSFLLIVLVACIRVAFGWDKKGKGLNEKIQFSENIIAVKTNKDNKKEIISNN